MAHLILDEGFQNNQETINLSFASQGKRIANYFIDIICGYAFMFLTASILLGLSASDESTTLLDDSESSLSGLASLVAYISFWAYYFLTETFLKGRTIGKLITGTRAITTQHEYLTAGNAFTRSLCRLVPFDALSFLFTSGYGWHDKWTNTMVVNEREFQEAYGR